MGIDADGRNMGKWPVAARYYPLILISPRVVSLKRNAIGLEPKPAKKGITAETISNSRSKQIL